MLKAFRMDFYEPSLAVICFEAEGKKEEETVPYCSAVQGA